MYDYNYTLHYAILGTLDRGFVKSAYLMMEDFHGERYIAIYTYSYIYMRMYV